MFVFVHLYPRKSGQFRGTALLLNGRYGTIPTQLCKGSVSFLQKSCKRTTLLPVVAQVLMVSFELRIHFIEDTSTNDQLH